MSMINNWAFLSPSQANFTPKVSVRISLNEITKKQNLILFHISAGSFPSGSDGKESTCNADLSLIPGSGRYPGEGKVNSSNILAWRIPWTSEPGSPRGRRESDTTERLTDSPSNSKKH